MAGSPITVSAPLWRALAGHRRRPVCRDGIRLIELEVGTKTTIQLRLQVGQAWHVEEDKCDSVVCVLPGSPLAGTAVLMREQAFVVHPQIWMRPSGSVRTIAVVARRSEDNVVGTDFSYDDLRMWTPRVITSATTAELVNGEVLLHSAWEYRGRYPVTARCRLDKCGVLVAVDLTAAGTAQSFRRLRAENVVMAYGMPTPLVMRITRPKEDFESVMRLRAMSPHGIAPELFTPARLADAAAVVAPLSLEAATIEEDQEANRWAIQRRDAD